jgi:hypothetical protein
METSNVAEKTDFEKLKELLEGFQIPDERLEINEPFEIDIYTVENDHISFFFNNKGKFIDLS